jgi:hypothetical protein
MRGRFPIHTLPQKLERFIDVIDVVLNICAHFAT